VWPTKNKKLLFSLVSIKAAVWCHVDQGVENRSSSIFFIQRSPLLKEFFNRATRWTDGLIIKQGPIYNTSTYAGPLHRAEVCRKQAVM
jgi:hypothetical protein